MGGNVADTGTVNLSNANTFTGDTKVVTAGKLALSNNLAIQNSAFDTSGAGTLTLSVTTPTFGGLKGGTDLATAISTGYSGMTALTLNPGTAVTDTYSGAIADGAAGMTLAKTGAGTQILSGGNTYTGATLVSAGTLTLSGSGGINSSSGITINGSGAKFVQTSSLGVTPAITLTKGTLDGTGTVGAVSVDAAGTAASKVVANGNIASNTALTLNSLIFNGTGTTSLSLPGGATTTSPGLAVTDALTLSGGAGSVKVNITPTAALVNGSTYQLISYGGVFSGTASTNFTLAPGVLTGRQNGVFASTAGSNGFITLAVAGDNPVWSGAASNVLLEYAQTRRSPPGISP